MQLQKTLEEEIYRLMDSFLVEGDKPRPIDRLNQDRHLFVDNLLELFDKTFEEVTPEEKEEIEREVTNFEQTITDGAEWNECISEMKKNWEGKK